LASKGSAMTFMAFHPHHMVLGCASSDGLRPGSTTERIGHVNVFQMQDYRKMLQSVTTTLSFSSFT
jgi:regulator-associated protein of mTOR